MIRKLAIKGNLRGVLMKLLLAFFLLTIPVYLVSLSLLGSAITSVKHRITDSVHTDLDRFLSRLTIDLERVKQFQLMLKNDENVQYFYAAQNIMSDYEKIALFKELKSKFELIVSNSSFIDDLIIDFPESDLRLSYVSGRTDIPSDDRSSYAEEDYSDGWLKTSYGWAELERTRSDVLSYTLFTRTLRGGTQKLHYVLRMNIALDQFRSLLGQLKVGKSGSALIVDRSAGFVIRGNDSMVSDVIGERLSEQLLAGESDGILHTKVDKLKYTVLYRHSPELNWTAAVYVPEREFLGEVRSTKQKLYVLIAVSVLSVIGFSYIIYRHIHKPIRVLYNAMQQVGRERYDTRIASSRNDEFDYIYTRFNDMIQRIEHAIQRDYLQQIRIKQSELNQLQAQINPHFLYNCFYSVYRMSKERDYEAIARMTDYLGRYYQFITYKSRSDEVTLQEEVSHSVVYLDIQSIRFEDQLSYELHVAPQLSHVLVPRLILQPLIENAIVHALEESAEHVRIEISAAADGGVLKLTVADNGPGIEEERLCEVVAGLEREHIHPDNSFALWNIHWRLKYKFGPGFGIAIGKRKEGGFVITLKLPLHEGGERSYTR
ncbi:cache domain-containing sensor histidine kinase [Paenibacillus chungangensis]|uniref:Sensor histidine kinase n=1 Tax=Paenibacillus chungangensis TaxID=696535 RepID=A0ABW3HPG2_9BACL